MSTPSGRPWIVFVCWGNICRSTMAEQVMRAKLADVGLGASVGSAGVSREEQGSRLDSRAAQCLRAHGYEIGDHRAHKITSEELSADLLIAMEGMHSARLLSMGADDSRVHLLTDFIPGREGAATPDPWYGGRAEFEATLATIEAAAPGIVAAVRELA
ncbi:low molecular weight protein-tyrosine-phosphatase [Propionibacterium sp.]|uniref:low molecular weight protein-tyrosine-phosphatase n=1 Tax=Propionibacterium sp. TaxID=1977903 RepID=UPI0039EA3094